VILGRPAEALLVDCPEAATDIDTPEDYARATGMRIESPAQTARR
jgi:hypothetical protein